MATWIWVYVPRKAGRLVSLSHSARLTVNLIVNLFSRGMDTERNDGAATRTSEPEPSGNGEVDRLEAQMARMIAEMLQMREDFAVGQKEAASKLARSSRRDPYSFRRKGNENQYRFCKDVEERLETTSAAITHAEKGAGREALARAKEAAKEGMELLTHRKKLIKLTDCSEVGWAVVEECVDDNLADDSDDVWRRPSEQLRGRLLLSEEKSGRQVQNGPG